MLGRQSEGAIFSGGIDSRLVDDWFAEKVKQARVKYLFLAFDDEQNWNSLINAAEKLSFLGLEKLRSYVLVGQTGDTIQEAEKRCRAVRDLGIIPFAMYYRDETSKPPNIKWADFIRNWTRPAIIKARLRYGGKK
jgi:hypothetical protein